MKKIYYLTLAFIGVLSSVQAQTPCDLGRYYTELFPTVTTTSAVNFGTNTDFLGAATPLAMDIYEPTGDTETARPVIVWAHGGSFIGGTRTDADVVALSNAFAKRGYVCVSIDYRLGMWPIDSVNATKAVVRATQDMKAAVRFLYADAATTNAYKIDTNNIIIGGSSAGAITALHMAYLDQECEVEQYITASALNAMGGLEGTSGSPGYSTKVHAVINLAGALASYGWLEAGDIPFCSLQGSADDVVPYNRGVANVSGFTVMSMDGSRVLDAQADVVGVQCNLYTHYGAGHAPYATAAAYMDTTINFVTDFLVDYLACSEPLLQPENAPIGVANLYPLTYCGLGINGIESYFVSQIFPNPSNDQMNISIKEGSLIQSVEVLDLTGRLIQSYAPNASSLSIAKSNIGNGSFVVRITNSEGVTVTKNIIFQ